MSQSGFIAVIGGGNGAHAAAGDLALRGYAVSLYERPEFFANLETTAAQRGVIVHGAVEGFAPLRMVTSNAADVVPEASVVIVTAPAFAHDTLAADIAPHLREGQLVLFNPGALGSSVRFRRIISRERPDLDQSTILVGETASLTYGTRLTAPGTVDIHVVTRHLLCGAYPGRDSLAFFEAIHQLFPGTILARDVLDTGLNNGNPISHPTATVLNAGTIEARGSDFYLYRDGMTPSVVAAMQAVDSERLEICRAVGATILPVHERIVKFGYARPEPTLQLSYSTSPVYTKVAGPDTLRSRYLSEDVPYGLVPWASLASQIGVETPTMDAVITMASVLNDVDYRTAGTTMKSLGLDQLASEEVVRFFDGGETWLDDAATPTRSP